MRKKDTVMVFGLDGASFKILEPMMKKGDLPYLNSLTKKYKKTLSSTIPPLTGAAWSSFQTGVSPGVHGVFDFKDREGELISSKKINVPRIWEILNKRGCRSCVLNLPVSYPPSPINGYLVSSFLTPKEKGYTYPKELEEKLKTWGYKIDLEESFLPENESPGKKVFEEIENLAMKRLEAAEKLLSEEPWDFFFCLLKSTDLVQHYDFDGKRTVELYKLIDQGIERLVNEFRESYPERELHVIVLSDHGFHKIADKDLAFYPLFREMGLLPKRLKFTLKIKRVLRRVFPELWSKGKVCSYGMYLEKDEKSKKEEGEIVKKLRKVKIEGKEVFQRVESARELYGKEYSKEVPDIVWLVSKSFSPNADPLSDKLIYEKKTSLKGHHYGDPEGVLMVDSPLLKPGEGKIAKITEVLSLIADILKVPVNQKVEKHKFELKQKSSKEFEKKVKRAREVVKKGSEKWSNSAIAWTGGKDSTVLLHLVRSMMGSGLPVMFIDHGSHFPETLAFVERIKDEWELDLKIVRDKEAIARYRIEKDKKKRKELTRAVKISAIKQTLDKYGWDGLYVGIRKDEHEARSDEREFSERKNHIRIHPLLDFTEEDVWEYIYQFKICYNPLYDKGYRSLGAKEFTKPVWGKDLGERAGREKDKEKVMERLRKLGYF